MYAKDLRLQARQKLEGKWGIAILVALLASILGGAIAGSNVSFNFEFNEETLAKMPREVLQVFAALTSLGGILGFVQFIIGGAIQLGYCRFLLKLQDDEEATGNDLFSCFNRFADGFLLSLLTGIFVFLWMLLFIIPGIIAAYSYAMAPFILLENPNMKAREALKASKAMMDGHKGELFILNLSFIGWALLCILTLGIGFLWLNPYQSSAYAAFYRNLQPKAVAPAENWEQNDI